MPSLTPAAAIRRSQRERELEAAADRVAVERRDVGKGKASSASIASVNGWATSFSASSAKTSSGRSPMS